MPYFSLIVPVYNTAPYLDRCVESIRTQNYEDWELILIDDGSTDGSFDICERWSKLDGRIQAHHQHNQGVSAARNRALQYATGDWVWFIDSDDYILPRSLESLACATCSNNADLFIFNESVKATYRGSLDGFIKQFYLTYIVGFGPCNKIYQRRIIEDNSLCFDVEESIGEDLLFNLSYYLHCSQYVFLGEYLYCYDRREGSAMTTVNITRHVNQMRLFKKLFALLNNKISNLHMAILYFLHLMSGINQSREAGLSLWKAWKLIHHYRHLFPFSRAVYWDSFRCFLESERASLLGKIRMYLMFFPY